MAQNLAQRAQQAAETNRSAPALVSSDDHPDSMERLIVARKERFAQAMGIDPDQLMRDAVTAVRLTPRLRECTPGSVLGALMTAAQLRLRVGVLGHCWILPYWSRTHEVFEASFVLGYQGLVMLGDRAGVQLMARPVHEHDHLELEYGTENERLIHRRATRGLRGPAYGYYAIGRAQNRRPEIEYMSKEEVIAWRDEHANAGSPAWRLHFDGMARKTVLKQVARYMPKSANGDLAIGIAADEGVRIDDDPSLTADVLTEHGEHEAAGDEPAPGPDDQPDPEDDSSDEAGQADQPQQKPPQRRRGTRKG